MQSSDQSSYEEEQYQSLKPRTRYPYNRLQLFRQLKIPPQMHEPTFKQEDCEDVIKKELEDMEDYDYDFIYSTKKQPNRPFKKSIRRKVKLRLVCKNCPDKTWTSIVGTIQIEFALQDIGPDEPQLVNFRVYLYRMLCQRCSQWGISQIYESQLITVSKIFCLTVAEMVEGLSRPKHKDNRYKMNEEMHDHKEELCEACMKGKCFARPKGLQYQEPKQRSLLYKKNIRRQNNNVFEEAAKQGVFDDSD